MEEEIPLQSADQAMLLAGGELQELQSSRNGLPAAHDAISKAAGAKAAEVEKEAARRIESMLADPSHAYGLEFLIETARLLEKECLDSFRALNERAAGIDTASMEAQIAPPSRN